MSNYFGLLEDDSVFEGVNVIIAICNRDYCKNAIYRREGAQEMRFSFRQRVVGWIPNSFAARVRLP